MKDTARDSSNAVTQFSLRSIELRPYQLLCLVCRLGERQSEAGRREPFEALNLEPFWHDKHAFLDRVLDALRSEPDIPVVLRCNAGGVFAWQDPGPAHDSPEGREFNLKRDLDILRQLDLAPGATMPARSLLYRMQNHLKTVRGVCGYETCTSSHWQGCPKAQSEFYERGNAIDIDDIVPVRTDEERAGTKAKSIRAMENARAVRIRPHLLMCAVCQYGMGIVPPFQADNLPEFLALIRDKPDTLVTLVSGADWMMCAPCKRRDPATGACVNVSGLGGLSNDLRDLNVLQLLGLAYGSTMTAGTLYRLLLEKIPSTRATCTKVHAQTSTWWDCCGDLEDGNPSYVDGTAKLSEWKPDADSGSP